MCIAGRAPRVRREPERAGGPRRLLHSKASFHLASGGVRSFDAVVSSLLSQPEPCARDLALILAAARERSGVDFGCYRPATLERRVQSRMLTVSARTYREYLRRLGDDPGEIDLLLQRLTIKVSRFFRNPKAFRRLQDILRERRAAEPREPLRIWSAGCGRGEEPYSLAMLLRELPGPAPAGSVCATDVDRSALDAARAGRYPAQALEEMPPALRSRYMVDSGHARLTYRVADAVASLVTFLPHDLTTAPAPPLDGGFHLICCRNVLIYLRPPAQRRVFDLLLAGLAPGAHVCLGRAELPPNALLSQVATVDRVARVFRLARPRTKAPRGYS